MQVSKLEGRLSQVQIEKDEATQHCAAERRRAVAAETQGQQRLVGALRRLDYLVRCCPMPSSHRQAGCCWLACPPSSQPRVDLPADGMPVPADAVYAWL